MLYSLVILSNAPEAEEIPDFLLRSLRRDVLDVHGLRHIGVSDVCCMSDCKVMVLT